MTEGLLRCAAGENEFAIRAGDVLHVARADQLRADDTADGRAGVVKLGGYLVPVFSLRSRLGLPDLADASERDQHIAVTGDQDQLVGWLVERVTRDAGIGDLQIAQLPPAIGGEARRWFDGVVLCANRPVLLINPRQLNPLTPAPAIEPAPAFLQLPLSDDPRAEPVALVFSTTALPEADTNRFALSARQVAAIVQPAETIGIPGCATHVAGLTFWRDVVVPVFDFRGARDAANPNRRRLIARCGANGRQSLIAFPIDTEVVMHKPAADDRLIADAVCPSFATGVFSINGDRVALLDLDALVSC